MLSERAAHVSVIEILTNEGCGMDPDPITLIVTALATGAALGTKDTASAAVKDAYASLKALARKRLGSGTDADLVLAKHEKAPETWNDPLTAELTESGAEHDDELIVAAQALLELTGGTGGHWKMPPVEVRDSTVVQIGNHNWQGPNIFGREADS